MARPKKLKYGHPSHPFCGQGSPKRRTSTQRAEDTTLKGMTSWGTMQGLSWKLENLDTRCFKDENQRTIFSLEPTAELKEADKNPL